MYSVRVLLGESSAGSAREVARSSPRTIAAEVSGVLAELLKKTLTKDRSPLTKDRTHLRRP